MLRKKLDTLKKNLEKLRRKESDFEKRTKELEARFLNYATIQQKKNNKLLKKK